MERWDWPTCTRSLRGQAFCAPSIFVVVARARCRVAKNFKFVSVIIFCFLSHEQFCKNLHLNQTTFPSWTIFVTIVSWTRRFIHKQLNYCLCVVLKMGLALTNFHAMEFSNTIKFLISFRSSPFPALFLDVFGCIEPGNFFKMLFCFFFRQRQRQNETEQVGPPSFHLAITFFNTNINYY